MLTWWVDLTAIFQADDDLIRENASIGRGEFVSKTGQLVHGHEHRYPSTGT